MKNDGKREKDREGGRARRRKEDARCAESKRDGLIHTKWRKIDSKGKEEKEEEKKRNASVNVIIDADYVWHA